MQSKKRDFDLAALTWDENPQRVQLAKDIFASIAGAVKLNEGMTVLDFGCGTGLLSLQILERTGNVTCADSSAGMLEVLENKVKKAGLEGVKTIHLKSGDGEGLSGSFDLITSSMTFHHVQDVQSITRKLSCHLNPGGKLCVADLAPENGRFHEDNTGVFHFGFTPEEMMKHFSDAGLKDVKSMTASTVERKIPSGETAAFTVFLVTGTV